MARQRGRGDRRGKRRKPAEALGGDQGGGEIELLERAQCRVDVLFVSLYFWGEGVETTLIRR
jgi:hypothetical protein